MVCNTRGARGRWRALAAAGWGACVLSVLARAAPEPPREWVDPATGHRIVRLSQEGGTASLYFNLNPYTPDGRKLIVTTPSGIATVDLATRRLALAVPMPAGNRWSVIGVGRRMGKVYYVVGDERNRAAVYSAGLDGGAPRKLADLPPHCSVATVNADETLAAGTLLLDPPGRGVYGAPPREAPGAGLTFAERKEVNMYRRLEAHLRMRIFTVALDGSGAVKTLVEGTDWLNHLQFSPTDPGLLLYCHEGPWHRVDRIWLVRAGGGEPVKVHTRTMNMEIAGHEWWAADGQSVWYDLQTPRGEDFWVASYAVAEGSGHARQWFHVERNQWSVHYNRSGDGSLFAGDGGDSEMVAHAPDGKWIWLFRPRRIPDVAGISAPNAAELIEPGVFAAEKLVNMSRHNYQLEPNVSFTPDRQWVVFRSNMFGPTHVFAVKVARERTGAAE